uniref:Uncharacterized protein n=1 Tax=Meloidogyne enterolobii TaxID=390850 RepID=A0A6V7WRR4_MELEN|nr:unnamed protein product [Meloidogyne enterolobii]CAD2198611.1 unnamed protein product [Meloidogyne enterolobii]
MHTVVKNNCHLAQRIMIITKRIMITKFFLNYGSQIFDYDVTLI